MVSDILYLYETKIKMKEADGNYANPLIPLSKLICSNPIRVRDC